MFDVVQNWDLFLQMLPNSVMKINANIDLQGQKSRISIAKNDQFMLQTF